MGLPAFSGKRVTLRSNVIELERGKIPKRVRRTKSILLEVTPEQAEAIKELMDAEVGKAGKPHRTRAAYLRSLIRERYESLTDKDFPPDPQYGGKWESKD